MKRNFLDISDAPTKQPLTVGLYGKVIENLKSLKEKYEAAHIYSSGLHNYETKKIKGPTAWCSFLGTAGSALLVPNSSFRVTSVAWTALGKYQVTWNANIGTYALSAHRFDFGSNKLVWGEVNSGTQATLHQVTWGGVYANSDLFTLIAWG